MSVRDALPVLVTGICLTALTPGGAEIVINEIHYNSEPNTAVDEFVEIYNSGAEAVDLAGWYLTDGVEFTFPAGTSVEPGGFVVVAERPSAVLAGYGVEALGPYGGRFSSQEDTVELRNAAGMLVDRVQYRSGFPWPTGPDGTGASMELIHPSLDNDLGGSWRASLVPGALPELTLLAPASASWRWRPGDSEASAPVGAWRANDFIEDGTWSAATSPLGFGNVTDVNLNTTIEGMQGVYSSLFLRNTFQVAPGEIPNRLQLRFTVDDGMIVWINGVEAARFNMPDGEIPASGTASGSTPEGVWHEVLLEGAAGYVVEGTNVIAVQLFNQSSGSSDLGFDLELIRPEPDPDEPPRPTPGQRNSVFAQNAPPQSRQVEHQPKQPGANEPTVVSVRVTDPDGVQAVRLEYQTVAPGAYVPAYLAKPTSLLLQRPNDPNDPNPAYHDPANWTQVAMNDAGTDGDAAAGDGTFSATLPGRPNRTLVRYRIVVEDTLGASVRIPYADDPSLNFAWFVYDGVPDYVAGTRSVLGAVPQVHKKEDLTAMPVYHLLCTQADYDQCVAYSGGNQIPSNNYDARSAYNWHATFVYDGEVYDNIGFRLRQRNARYSGSGKRSFRFRFNDGNLPYFRDMNGNRYPTPWRTLSAFKLVGSRGNPTWGLYQSVNHILWNMTGTPAPFTHWMHLRVVKGADEAPEGANGQYFGDFWGLMLAFEEFHVDFLDAHGLEKGNLYKLISYQTDGVSVRRYQAPDAVDDGSDFRNIIFGLRPTKDADWLNRHVNYPQWYRYHAIVDAVRHYDVQPNTGEHLKNRAYYFEPMPEDGNPYGRLWVLPWDSDTSWGPNWNAGEDFCKQAIFGVGGNSPKPEFVRDYRNVVREIRDLVWQEDQINLLIDSLASRIAPFVPADRDRWRSAPAAAGTQSDPPIDQIVQDMKRFAFIGGSWVGGSDSIMEPISRDNGLSGQQGRDAYLDALGADAAIPDTPTIAYSGAAGFPQDGIRLSSTAFSDPQGAGTFASMQYRVAEVRSDLANPKLEWETDWTSGDLEAFAGAIDVPPAPLRVGSTYRARVRHADDSGRWSHWSAPLEFTVTEPTVAPALANLVISEFMYHPLPPTAAELAVNPLWTSSAFEWIEVMNTGDEPIDLSGVRFTKGVDFDFVNGTIQTIDPGQRIVVVGDIEGFNTRYGFAQTPAFVAGRFDRNLSDGGEQLKLSFGGGTPIRDFVYLDDAPWPEEADGGGASLVLVDPTSRPDHALSASWRASVAVGGSPGTEELTKMFTGDPQADDDGDGVPALVEYATGGSDQTAGDGPEIGVRRTGNAIDFLVPRDPLAADVTFAFEVSLGLSQWTPADFVGWEPAGDGIPPRAIYRLAETGATAAFGRIRVELR